VCAAENAGEKQHDKEKRLVDRTLTRRSPRAPRGKAEQQSEARIQHIDADEQVAIDVEEVPERAHDGRRIQAKCSPGHANACAFENALHHQTSCSRV